MSEKHKPLFGFLLAVAAIAALWIFSMPGEPVKLDGWSHSVAQASAVAQENDRPMLMMFTADWCPPCKMMKKSVLNDAKIDSALRERFSLVMVDIEAAENSELVSSYAIASIPTFIITDPEGKETKRTVGFLEARAFVDWAM